LNDGKPLCATCLYCDKRPESGTQAGLAYCLKKRIIVTPKTECAVYARATARAVENLKASLYGTIPVEEHE